MLSAWQILNVAHNSTLKVAGEDAASTSDFLSMYYLGLLTILVFAHLPGVLSGLIQKAGLVLPPGSSVHRDAVKNIFLTSYNAYK